MFEPTKPIYMTKAISIDLPEEHKQFILRFLHDHHEILTDYFQVFEFYTEGNQQWLIQKQEQPERETTFLVDLKNTKPIDSTVWAMDQDKDGVIILYPSDY